MSSRKHFFLALIAAAVVLAGGFGLLVWPSLSQAAQVAADIEDLDHKNRTLEERMQLVKELSAELDEARTKASRSMKRIPATAEPHEVLDALDMKADGYYVVDHSTTSREIKPAALDESTTAMALPITVTMVARFEAVQELIRRAESMDRLVRVAKVTVRRHPEKSSIDRDDEALLAATIELEAIFDPRTTGSAAP